MKIRLLRIVACLFLVTICSTIIILLCSLYWGVLFFLVFSFLIIAKPIFQVLNSFIKKSEGYQYKYHDVLKFKQCKFNLDVINLGSNSGKFDFDYSESSVNAMNWAVGPQTLMFDLRVLKNYHSYIARKGVVFLPICPFSSIKDRFTGVDANDKYYLFLNPIYIDDFQLDKRSYWEKAFHFPIIYSIVPILKYQAKKILLKERESEMNSDELSRDANQFMISWGREFDVTNWENDLSNVKQDIYQKNIQNIIEIVSFCYERDLRPVLILPPVTDSLSAYFTDSMKQKYIYNLVEGVKNSTDVEFLDYFTDSRFTSPDLYRNSYFMNPKGAKLFTNQLLTDTGLC